MHDPVESVPLDSQAPLPTEAVQQHTSSESPASRSDTPPTRNPAGDDPTAPARTDQAAHTDHAAQATGTHDDCSDTEHTRDDRDESRDRHDDGEAPSSSAHTTGLEDQSDDDSGHHPHDHAGDHEESSG
jgi:hypothetical protein